MAAKKETDAQAATEAIVAPLIEQGFRGLEVDPTPNEHYTVTGVIAGKPTPETDPDHARDVRAQLDDRSA